MRHDLFWFAWCAGMAGWNGAVAATGDAWDGWTLVHVVGALLMLACAAWWFRHLSRPRSVDLNAAETRRLGEALIDAADRIERRQ